MRRDPNEVLLYWQKRLDELIRQRGLLERSIAAELEEIEKALKVARTAVWRLKREVSAKSARSRIGVKIRVHGDRTIVRMID